MLKAIMDKVVIEIEALPEKTIGGIWLPETLNERDHIGVVVSVGEKVVGCKVGDRVYYNVYSEKLERDGKEYRVVKEENVLAVLDIEVQVGTSKKNSGGQVAWENLD